MSAEDVFNAAPRKSELVDINGVPVTLVEMSVAQRISWGNFNKENEGNTEAIFAYSISLCCQELSGVSHNEILEKLSPDVIIDLGNKILGLSGLIEGKKKD